MKILQIPLKKLGNYYNQLWNEERPQFVKDQYPEKEQNQQGQLNITEEDLRKTIKSF